MSWFWHSDPVVMVDIRDKGDHRVVLDQRFQVAKRILVHGKMQHSALFLYISLPDGIPGTGQDPDHFLLPYRIIRFL